MFNVHEQPSSGRRSRSGRARPPAAAPAARRPALHALAGAVVDDVDGVEQREVVAGAAGDVVDLAVAGAQDVAAVAAVAGGVGDVRAALALAAALPPIVAASAAAGTAWPAAATAAASCVLVSFIAALPPRMGSADVLRAAVDVRGRGSRRALTARESTVKRATAAPGGAAVDTRRGDGRGYASGSRSEIVTRRTSIAPRRSATLVPAGAQRFLVTAMRPWTLTRSPAEGVSVPS